MHLYKSPTNKFVAGFIGSPTLNFLKGRQRFQENYFFEHETKECTIYLGTEISLALEKYLDEVIQIGIRPEDIISQSMPAMTIVQQKYWLMKIWEMSSWYIFLWEIKR
jgi:multiple sugar transport system ATP-binding protein